MISGRTRPNNFRATHFAELENGPGKRTNVTKSGSMECWDAYERIHVLLCPELEAVAVILGPVLAVNGAAENKILVESGSYACNQEQS